MLGRPAQNINCRDSSGCRLNLIRTPHYSRFKMRNIPGEIQRQYIVDRGSSATATVQAELIDVIHRKLSPNGDLATLITIEFRFISTNISRRVQSASVQLQFADSESRSDFDPEVLRIAPDKVSAIVSFGSFTSLTEAQQVHLGAQDRLGNNSAQAWNSRRNRCRGWFSGWFSIGEKL